jgi:predicted dehydrogenase
LRSATFAPERWRSFAELSDDPRVPRLSDDDQRERVRTSISICTWPQHHLEIVRVAQQLGVKGILCEKPMALEMREVER